MKKILSALASKTGFLLAVLSIGFVAWKLWSARGDIADWELGPGQLLLIAVSILVYTLCCTSQAAAWHFLVRLFGALHLTFLQSFMINARSQLAKYIPGNIFHFTGRHVMGKNAGIGHAVLAAALVSEIAGLITVAFLLIVLARFGIDTPSLLEQYHIREFSIGAIVIVLVLQFILPRRLAGRELPAAHYRFIVFSNSLYALFFLVMSTAFGLTVFAVSGGVVLPFHVLLSVTALSWLAGFVTPGAPAGLGVRDLVMMTLLGGHVSETAALLSVAVFRIVTVAGDTVFFLESFPVERLSRNNSGS